MTASIGCLIGPHVYVDATTDVLTEEIPVVDITFYHNLVPRSPSKICEAIAVDCEMSYTTAGLELVRITALDVQSGNVLLDELVFPSAIVIDLNTRFSGIKSLQGCKYDLSEAMSQLANFVDQNTIIIGHGLENDLKAMRLVHKNVIDTVMLYPHFAAPQIRHSLRLLTKKYLGKFIQDTSDGHDSAEDARCALELLKLKVKRGLENNIPKKPI